MSNAKFNPQAFQTKPPKQQKEMKKKKRFLFQKKKTEPSDRMIQFSQKSAMSVFSGAFFCLFLLMSVVLLLNFGRVDTLTRLAVKKQVNPETLLTEVNQTLSSTEQLKYEGQHFIERLFTYSPEKRNEWETSVNHFLAQGLEASDLGFVTTATNRVAKDVRFIKLEEIDTTQAMYRLFYEVTFTEGDHWKSSQLSFPVSYQNNVLKVLDGIQFLNLSESKNTNSVNYQENRFYSSGQAVNESEEIKLEAFVKRFFELYVKNDEKLALISNEKGLEGGELVNVQLDHAVKNKEGNYLLQGKYRFYFEKGNEFQSNFSMEVKTSGDSYFVTTLNE